MWEGTDGGGRGDGSRMGSILKGEQPTSTVQARMNRRF